MARRDIQILKSPPLPPNVNPYSPSSAVDRDAVVALNLAKVAVNVEGTAFQWWVIPWVAGIPGGQLSPVNTFDTQAEAELWLAANADGFFNG